MAFVLTTARVKADLSAFRRAILEVDEQFPWHDDPPRLCPEESAPSIFYLSDGDEVINNWSTPEKTCWFTIFPKYHSIRKGQVYAYERYLAKLAEELVKKRLPFVAEVRSVLHIDSGTSFKVQ
ncbi:MAG: hypothetical protein Q8Q46_00295 [Candidatus Giovannonibacteria bacterium]|nr:hypothetical protein [Candidatus Giovannonibacteria bacterium]